jgi:GNAT superfamily N-acetyltransferase
MELTLEILPGVPVIDGIISKPYADDNRFNTSWWRGETRPPAVFCSFVSAKHGEVVRALIRPEARLGGPYPTYERRHTTTTEIDLFEVRPDMRDRGFATEALELLADQFPRPLGGLSLNKTSDGFWRKIGWTEHPHEEADPDHPSGRGLSNLFIEPY